MGTMKAVQFHEFGDLEVLRYEDVERPEPGHGQLRIRIKAAGVNPIDWKLEAGLLREKTQLPKIAGLDFSGVVDQLGSGVTEYAVGDEVFGRCMGTGGSYAEYVVVKPEDVARKPRNLDHLHAAAIPTAALAAWQGLFESAGTITIGLTADHSILIHGAAGGVGTFAVQLARWKGAWVIATGRANDVQYLHGLGANVVIDYQHQRFEDLVTPVDAVFDLVGGETQQRSWQVIKPGGVLVSTVGIESPCGPSVIGIRAVSLFASQSSWELAQIAQLVEDGAIVVPVSEVQPLSGAREAQEHLRAGGTYGKVVLEIGG